VARRDYQQRLRRFTSQLDTFLQTDPHTNASKVANFFFAAAFGLVVTAQWELSVGNGFSYTVFSAFGELHFCPCSDPE
jgi:succinate-acetate transporter protein